MKRGTKSLLVSVTALGLLISGASLATAAGGGAAYGENPHTISGKAFESDGTTPAVGLTVSAAATWDNVTSTYDGQTRADGSYTILVGYATAYTVMLGDYSGGSGDISGGSGDLSGASASFGAGGAFVTEGRKDPTCDITVSRTRGVGSVVNCTNYLEFNSPLADEELTDAVRGGVTLDKVSTTVNTGPTVTVQLPTKWTGAEVYLFVYSDPRALTAGAVRADATTARVSAVLPKDLTVGFHKVAAYDYYGNLIGWAPIEVKAAATTPASAHTTKAAARTGSLPQTGSNATLPLLVGAGGLILAGGALFLANNRRHRQAASDK